VKKWKEVDPLWKEKMWLQFANGLAYGLGALGGAVSIVILVVWVWQNGN